MRTSVRARLTLWYTAMLAVLLTIFLAAAYGFVVSTSRARTDAMVLDAVSNLKTELLSERRHKPTTLAAAQDVFHDLHFQRISFVLFDSSGSVVSASVPGAPVPAGEEAASPPDVERLGRMVVPDGTTESWVVTLPNREGGYRAALVPLTTPEGRFTAAAATSLDEEEETLGQARRAVFIAVPVALLLAGLSGSLLARRSLQPMVTMRERAARIGATNLSERVPIGNPADEVGQLATVINDLLGRLEQAFARQRQFMADASHELRTPVAVVQHESSLALSRPERETEDYQDSLSIIRDAGRRMRLLVDDLFLLASADAGELPIRREPLYLDEVVGECARAVRALAERRRITVTLSTPEEAPLTGDEALLHRLILNLLDNAIKYSPPGAMVSLRLTVDGDLYRLEVADTGPGIPKDLQPLIFERFVRADAARSHDQNDTSGAGLGLSIARWIANAHGGQLELARASAEGSVFVLRLPVGSA